MKVSYLGPKGTFSYEICKKYCKNSFSMVEGKTIPEVINMLFNDEVDKAIVPIENSLQGGVTDSIDTLIQNDMIFVEEELVLEISQNLMSNSNCRIDELEKIYSHSQAIAQSKNFLIEHNLLDKIILVDSTAEAAWKVSKMNEKCACIGNLMCLEEYNLHLIQDNIQYNMENKTKFWVLSKINKFDVSAKKMSVLFAVKDKPGSLYEVLKIFNDYNLNLTKIESRPAKTVLGEYIFLIDVSIGNENEDEAIEKVKKQCLYLRVLGKY